MRNTSNRSVPNLKKTTVAMKSVSLCQTRNPLALPFCV